MPAFSLPAVVDQSCAAALARQAAAELGADAGAWRVDAAALQQFDSSFLALLLQLQRQAGAGQLQVDGAPPRLRQLAAAYGLDFVFGAAD